MAKVLPHDFDGIQEYDNPVPGWLSHLFIWTTVFGIIYAIYYPSFWFYGGVSEWSSSQQYEQQMATEQERYSPLQAAAQAKALEALKSLSHDEATLKAGSAVFVSRCAACHGEAGVGKIGPALNDAEWLYGGDAKEVLHSIREGRPKGMPAWKNELKKDEVQSVTAYVLSLGEGAAPEVKPTPESTPETADNNNDNTNGSEKVTETPSPEATDQPKEQEGGQ